MTGAVAFVLKGYPRLSETFIANEIRALEQRGFDIRIVSLRHPTDASRHPVHDEIRASILYLPEYLWRSPWRIFRAWLEVRRLPGYRRCLRTWWKDLKRDPSSNRVRRFGQALVLARELDEDVAHLHAHFLHTPASVTRYTSLLLGRPWSCSAHARDIWTTPDWEKREKLASASWTVTCTEAAHVHLQALAPEPERVALVYHGLDTERFPPPGTERPARDGRNADDPVCILSVGRAVEKKGYDDLLGALASLPEELHWQFDHVGAGPWLGRLKRLARQLGIDSRVHWRGALSAPEVLDCYTRADLFVLASRIAGDGDRDGLPNVLMEAQSQGLPCIATRVSAIPELVIDGDSGLLVEAGDVDGLAAAMARLIRDPETRHRLGAAGRARVSRWFRFDKGIDQLEAKLNAAGAQPAE